MASGNGPRGGDKPTRRRSQRGASSSTSRSRKQTQQQETPPPERGVVACHALKAGDRGTNPCQGCDTRAATVQVGSTGRRLQWPLYCTLCHEKMCAREWRDASWTRYMR
jgi:hypothetical protein